MSKNEYTIQLISKDECTHILDNHHYLSTISNGFKSGHNYGLMKNKEIVGVCIFTGFPVPELAKGAFGLERHEQQGLFELSRLCVLPSVQSSEHNITSWFVSKCLKEMKKQKARAILSYADSGFHDGTIYRACNFTYYGLSAQKSDFWVKLSDGTFSKQSRGKTKGIDGEWRPRNQKHRFMIIYDKKLTCKWCVQ